MPRGIILAVEGHPLSGLHQLRLRDGEGCERVVQIESGFAMRRLHEAFGGDFIGREIVYETDHLGVLAAFKPVDENF